MATPPAVEASRVARVDALGLVCPMPLIRLQARIESLAPGERVELVADDPGVEDDLPAWSQVTGHRLLSLERADNGVWVALIECGVSAQESI